MISPIFIFIIVKKFNHGIYHVILVNLITELVLK